MTEPSEHAKHEAERVEKFLEEVEKEREKERKKPKGLAMFENPRIAKSSGLYKIGDKVLADWVRDRRRRGIIVGLDPSKKRKYIVKIGNEIHNFFEEDLNFMSEKNKLKNPRWSQVEKVGTPPYNFAITTPGGKTLLGYTVTMDQAEKLAEKLANKFRTTMEIREN